LTDQHLELIFGRLSLLHTSLPIAAGVAEQATATSQARELILGDPALAANLLAAANRDRPGTVRTISQAVRILGWEAVRQIALRSAPPCRADEPPGKQWRAKAAEFRTHCQAVAEVMRRLVDRLALPVDPEEAFLCGLLHDLGKSALWECFPKSYARVLSSAEAYDEDLIEAERTFLGVDHVQAGRKLAGLWHLPEAIGNTLWLHHQSPEVLPHGLPDRRLIGAVGLADRLVQTAGLGFPRRQKAVDVQGPARELGLGKGALERIIAQVRGLQNGRAGVSDRFSQRYLQRQRVVLEAVRREMEASTDELRRRADGLALRADAFDCINGLARRLARGATLHDVLCEIARSTWAFFGFRADENSPIIVYSRTEESLLVLRWSPSLPPAGRTLPPRPGGPSAAVVGPARTALSALLIDENSLDDFFEAAAYAHYPLLCAGEWVGGVFVARANDPHGHALAEVFQAVGEIMGLLLGISQDRSRALRLSEQLAGASRAYAAREQLRTEEKTISALGELASGAAHELNNPLAVVSGRAQLMSRKASTEQERQTWQLIAEQAQRISDVITELMEFASPPAPSPRSIEATKLLSGAKEAFSSSDHPNVASVKVDIEVDEDVPPILADEAQIRAVIVELIANAVTAAGRPVRVKLEARCGEGRRTVRLGAVDDGPGMDGPTLANAFVPFFSVQQAGRRRGMGLPRAKRIVENNGGRMWIRSKAGEGTAVFMELPAAPTERTAEEKKDVGS